MDAGQQKQISTTAEANASQKGMGWWGDGERNLDAPNVDGFFLQKGYFTNIVLFKDFPGGSGGKASTYNAGDLGLIPGSGRSPGEGNGNPLQYSCLENPMDAGAW